MRFIRFVFASTIAVLFFNFSARAELKVAAIFGDNMVLQQQMRMPVWGRATPNANVTVTFAGQTKSTRADADGKWQIKLDKLKASFTSQTMTVESGDRQIFTNILVGEVWLASGQSNMEKPIGKYPGQRPCLNAEQELAASDYPNIRIFKVERFLSETPVADLRSSSRWLACNSNSLDRIKFSAAAYFFGREIHTNLNVPVGLVESSWGGTRIEPWTSSEGFKKFPEFAKLATAMPVSKLVFSDKHPPTAPRTLYNAMIAPIAGFAMRGALWYQGESNLMGTNADNDYLTYEKKMEALVGGWREVWNEGDFPFYFVQIAPFKYCTSRYHFTTSPEMEAEFWELQSQASRKIKNTGMVVTTDLVDNLNDIHPRNKQDVGHRLALLALDKTYDKKVESSGPVFEKAKFKDGKAILEFEHDDGLMSKDGKPLTWFTIAGADGKFVPADAKIVGKTVEVSSPDVKEPKAVRFAWSEIAQPNLFNKAGLPCEPFRTDKP